MTLALTQTKTALTTHKTASFLGVGGTGTYSYSVLSGGAGGSINSSTGIYTSPGLLIEDPAKRYDTVQVADSLGATATAQILVGSPMQILWEIIVTQTGIDPSRVWFWNQKVFSPTDSDVYVVISIPRRKVYSNNTHPSPGWDTPEQYANIAAEVDINIISRSEAAIDMAEAVLLAIHSPYSVQQQEANSMQISRIPKDITDLSSVDGASIPYRFMFSVVLNYAASKVGASDYFDTFQDVALEVSN